MRVVAQSQHLEIVAEISEKLVWQKVIKNEKTLRGRILSGMDETRRQGKHLGRPYGSTETKEAFLKKHPSVVRNRRQGISVRKTAKICNISINTVRKVSLFLNTNPQF